MAPSATDNGKRNASALMACVPLPLLHEKRQAVHQSADDDHSLDALGAAPARPPAAIPGAATKRNGRAEEAAEGDLERDEGWTIARGER